MELNAAMTRKNPANGGHIKIGMDGEIEEIQFSNYEYGKQAYAAATVHKLRDLLEAGHIPEEATVIWY